jgi:proteasome activator subunit 4
MLADLLWQSILASQYYMVAFLPISHPQSYLPMMFRLWQSVNSYAYDERMLHFLARLTEMHIDPTVSDPKRINQIPDDARSEGEDRPQWDKSDLDDGNSWSGIYKDVGIFSDDEWSQLMCKTLASMGEFKIRLG